MFSNIKYLLLLLLTGGALACTDLVEDPIAILAPETVFNTPRDVQTAVFGAYGRLAAEDTWGRKLSLPIMLRGDMLDIGDRGTPGRRQQVNDFNMDANNGMITAMWPAVYQSISAANAAIQGGELVGEPADEINALIAEARFIRAWSYYHLVRLYGEIPYITEFISDPSSVSETSKTSIPEIYEGIIADFEYGKEWLPDQYPNDVRSRPTKGSAAAFLASVHLTLQDFQSAYNEAKFVIDNKDRFNYALEAEFSDLFNDDTSDELVETIFSFDFLANSSGYPQGQDFLPTLTGMRGTDGLEGWSVAVPTFAVYEDWDSRDYRKSVSFDTTTIRDGVLVDYTQFGDTDAQRPHAAKYYRDYGGPTNKNNSDYNYILMRYAEVLLMAAEASNVVNGAGNSEATGWLNEVRTRARDNNPNNTGFPQNLNEGLGQDEFLEVVLEERRLELAFEGKRWYDIKRYDLGVQVFKGADSFEPHDNFDPQRDYLFPLPGDELERNANLLPQNPGY